MYCFHIILFHNYFQYFFWLFVGVAFHVRDLLKKEVSVHFLFRIHAFKRVQEYRKSYCSSFFFFPLHSGNLSVNAEVDLLSYCSKQWKGEAPNVTYMRKVNIGLFIFWCKMQQQGRMSLLIYWLEDIHHHLVLSSLALVSLAHTICSLDFFFFSHESNASNS